MRKLLFKGCATALITPFDEDGTIDFDSLGVLIQRQIAGGIDAIAVCGTTGEASTLSELEFDRIVSFAAEKIDGRVPLIAGVGKNDTRLSAGLGLSAARLGADGLLVVTPYYNKTSQQGLVDHFSAIAQRAELPVILYNVPSRTGMSIAAETYARLAENPLMAGVKEASGDMGLALAIKSMCPADFALYSGNDEATLPVLSIGGQGVISTVSNIVPSVMRDVCARWFEGEAEEAAQLLIRLEPLIRAVFCDVNPIPLKAAMQMMGYDSGALRLPLVPLPDSLWEKLKNVLLGMELI